MSRRLRDDEDLSSQFNSRVVPPIPPTSDFLPGSMQRTKMSGFFTPSNGTSPNGTTPDGFIYLPFSQGGTSIHRTALVTQGSLVLVNPNPVLNFQAAPLVLSVEMLVDCMLPVAPAVGGSSQFTLGKPTTPVFNLGRVVSGTILIQSSSVAPSEFTMSGLVGGSWIGDSRNFYDFERTRCAASSVYPGAEEGEVRLAEGIEFSVPPISPAMTGISAVVQYAGGQLVTVTDLGVPAPLVFSGPAGFVSHLTRASISSTVPSLTSPPLPWGAVPNLILRIAPTATLTSTLVVRAVHVFGWIDSTGPQTSTTFETSLVYVSPSDRPCLNITPLRKAFRYGLWLGSFLVLDGVDTVAFSWSVDVLFHADFEKELSFPFVARVDGAGTENTISVVANINSEVAPSNKIVQQQNITNTPVSVNFTPMTQFALIRNYFGDEPSVKIVKRVKC